MRYSRLYEINAKWLDAYAKQVRIVPTGKYADKLVPQQTSTPMKWDGIGKFVNAFPATFKYSQRWAPNSRWPWPFRNITAPTIVVNGVEIYSLSNELLFAFELNGLPHYLRPNDSIKFSPGNIEIGV